MPLLESKWAGPRVTYVAHHRSERYGPRRSTTCSFNTDLNHTTSACTYRPVRYMHYAAASHGIFFVMGRKRHYIIVFVKGDEHIWDSGIETAVLGWHPQLGDSGVQE